MKKKQHKKILWVVGCRPNFMKMFKHPNQIVLFTMQHYHNNMSNDFLKERKLPRPDIVLPAQCTGGNGYIYDGIKSYLIDNKKEVDYVMIPGDTNSALMGALAAYHARIPIIHLEAGVRSFSDSIEEKNRVLVDSISEYFLCPSNVAVRNLENEGIYNNVFNVGSNMVDSVWECFPTKPVKGYKKNEYNVLTLHRQELVDNKKKLKLVLEALGETGQKFVWPIHPRTEKNIFEFNLKVPSNIEVIDPVKHKKMVNLMAFANKVVTDSGGMQVESYFLRVPCVTIRTYTSWVETVEEKCNVLTGIDKDKIKKAIENHPFKKMKHSTMAYGQGNTNEIIKDFLKNL